jgi:organic hydroperoxide reductase OsmC/OhrA
MRRFRIRIHRFRFLVKGVVSVEPPPALATDEKRQRPGCSDASSRAERKRLPTVGALSRVVHSGSLAGVPIVHDASVPTHRYTAALDWSGTTAEGYEAYTRDHRAAGLDLSADPYFRGNRDLLNPEELLVIAASSCQLLSFLAVAARAHVDVRGYRDEAEGVMPEDEKPMRLTRIVLRPRIEIASDTAEERLQRCVRLAHDECFITNSLTSEVIVEPTFVRVQA